MCAADEENGPSSIEAPKTMQSRQTSQSSRCDPPMLANAPELPRITDSAEISRAVGQAYASIGHMLDNEEDAALLVDVLIHDFPLVGATRGFTSLTGYTLDEVLGRNCRMLTDGVPEVAISKSTRKNLRDYCRMCRLASVETLPEVVSVLPNARKDGSHFMNLFSICRVMVQQRPFLLGVVRSLGEGLFVKVKAQTLADVTEECRLVLRRLRQPLRTLPRPDRLPEPEQSRPRHFRFFTERLQDHCMIFDDGCTVVRREPQELATNCLVFGEQPMRCGPEGVFFAVLVNDIVPTFEGLPLLGFTQRQPTDSPDLYPTVSRCLGRSVLIGASGEAFARDQQESFRIGFKQPPSSEVESWAVQPDVPPHSRRPPVSIKPGDILGCMYTADGHLQLWANHVKVMDFDLHRPVDQAASYYPVIDVSLSAYSLTVLDVQSPLDETGNEGSASSQGQGASGAGWNLLEVGLVSGSPRRPRRATGSSLAVLGRVGFGVLFVGIVLVSAGLWFGRTKRVQR